MMTAKPVRIPGPDHPITISPVGKRMQVRSNGEIIVGSGKVLVLKEANYPPVYYFPRGDADLTKLAASDHQTYCPYKGDCSYFSIVKAGDKGVNAVWTYNNPYSAVAEIEGHLAFYPDRVEFV
jgi:uncharacterized protein (DUF427 family)